MTGYSREGNAREEEVSMWKTNMHGGMEVVVPKTKFYLAKHVFSVTAPRVQNEIIQNYSYLP